MKKNITNTRSSGKIRRSILSALFYPLRGQPFLYNNNRKRNARRTILKKKIAVSMVCIVVLFVLAGIYLHTPQQTETQIIIPINPQHATHEEITTITYKEPYEGFVQYFPSEEKTITNTEYLLVLLTEGWEDVNIDFSLARGMDSIGREHLAVARIVDGKYEIRAYQDIGLDNYAYVSASCSVTEYSLDEIYAGIKHEIGRAHV